MVPMATGQLSCKNSDSAALLQLNVWAEDSVEFCSHRPLSGRAHRSPWMKVVLAVLPGEPLLSPWYLQITEKDLKGQGCPIPYVVLSVLVCTL